MVNFDIIQIFNRILAFVAAKHYLCPITTQNQKNNTNMENEDLMKEVIAKANSWLGDGYDEETKVEVRRMLDAYVITELIDSFYRYL